MSSTPPDKSGEDANGLPDKPPEDIANDCKSAKPQPTAEPKLLPTMARGPIERQADEVQELPKKAPTIEGARPGDVARMRTKGGTEVTGRSKFADKDLDPRLQEALDKVPEAERSVTHGKCAEINSIDKALKAGEEVGGADIQTAKVRSPGHPEHGSPHAPCSSCSAVLKDLGVNYAP